MHPLALAPIFRTGNTKVYSYTQDSQTNTFTQEVEACSPRWAKCGGRDWTGPNCCTGDNICIVQSLFYSQCEPIRLADGIAAADTQCGGPNWQGPSVCEALYECNIVTEWYSQCQLIAAI